MAKGNGNGRRLTKKQMAEKLTAFFQTQPGETFSFKQIFKALHLTTHPQKMLAIDTMDEMAWDDFAATVGACPDANDCRHCGRCTDILKKVLKHN